MSLKDQIVKLAYDNPGEIRDKLLPILAVDKSASSMDRNDYWQWLQNIKMGDTVMFFWTAGSGGSYQGKARVVKVNRKSVVGELLEPVKDIFGSAYPKGHKLNLPTDPMARKFSEMFNSPVPVGVNSITRPKRGSKKWPAPGIRPNQVGWSTAAQMLDELATDLAPLLRGFKVKQYRKGTQNPSLSMYQGDPIPGTGVIGAKELSVRFMGNKWLVGAYGGLDMQGHEIYDNESVRSEFPDLGGYDGLLRTAKKMARKLV